MKTNILMTMLLVPGVMLSQNAYEDAQEYESKATAANGKIVLTVNCDDIVVLGSRYTNAKNFNAEAIIDSFDPNPFITIKLEAGTPSEEKFSAIKRLGRVEATLAGPAETMNLNSSFKADFTAIADGIARYLIEAANRELNVAFFQRLKKFLEKYTEFQILFPETLKTLGSIQATDYNNILPSLRISFAVDLDDLILNFDNVLLLPKYQEYVQQFPEILLMVEVVQEIKQLEVTDKSIAQIIPALLELEAWNYKDGAMHSGQLNDAYNFLVLSDVFSQNLVQTRGVPTPSWVKPKDFRDKILNSEVRLQLFLGFLWQDIHKRKIEFYRDGAPVALAEKIKNDSRLMSAMQNVLSDFTVLTGRLKELSTRDTDNMTDSAKSALFIQYVRYSIDVVEFASKVPIAMGFPSIDMRALDMVRGGLDFYEHIIARDYSGAIIALTNTIDVAADHIDDKRGKAKKTVKKEIGADIQRFEAARQSLPKDGSAVSQRADLKIDIKELKAKKKAVEKPDNTLAKVNNGIRTYGIFMANMVEAKDAESVKNAIAAAALPTGSSSIKKYHRHNIAINGYLGGNARFNMPDEKAQSWDSRIGFTAPVGISYTPFSFGSAGAISAFVSIIDVGAIAQFRINSDDELVEDISFGNIFSPGGYVLYGFGANIPLSAGIGAQYGPGLVSIGVDQSGNANANTIYDPSWRYSFVLAVDLPMFTIFKGRSINR